MGATGVPRAFVESMLAGENRDTAMIAQHVRVPRCQRCGAAPAALGLHCKRCVLDLRQDVQTAVNEQSQQTIPPRPLLGTARRSRSGGTGRGG